MDPAPADNTNRQLRATVGFVVAGLLIIGLGAIGGLRRPPPTGAVPPLRIVAPATGDSVAAPLVIRFHTPADLRLDPRRGWSAGDLHLHLMLDGTELMPGAADISAAGDGTFEWRVVRAQPGSVRLHLGWAGADHRAVGGAADTIRVLIGR